MRESRDYKVLDHDYSKLDFAYQNVSEIILWIDRRGNILDANPAACSKSGYSKAELMEIKAHQLCSSCSPVNWVSYWNRVQDMEDITIRCQLATKKLRKSTFGSKTYHTARAF